MFTRILAAILVSFFSASTFAAQTAAPASSKGSSRIYKSSKKSRMKKMHLREPQVLEVGDSTIGIRAGQGSVFNGSPVLGGNYEYMFRKNWGLGAHFGYSTYDSSVVSGPVTEKWEYTVMTFVLQGSLHADLFQVENLDTYATLGLGRTFVSSKFTSNIRGLPAIGSADGDTTFLVAYLNARYFFDPQFAATASVGLGLGTLGLGLDYLF